jgi:hypothetical protein
LTIERDHWTENPPGTGTATAASSVEAYNARNFGNINSAGARDPVTTQDVYVRNKRNEANLTHIFEDDNGAFTNLIDAALPHRLLPAVPATGDDLYFGISTAVADSGPFDNLVFDVGTVQTNITDTDWLYWNGASWAAIPTIRDYTASAAGTGVAFSRTGIYSVQWEIPSNWAATAVNGVTAYWVRLNFAASDPGPTGATQQNRRIYTVTWPYVEVQATEINGTLPALLRILALQEDTRTVSIQRIFCGLRSHSRGANFTAVLNASDEQNPTGITVTAGTTSSFIDLAPSPTGRVIEYNPAGVDAFASRASFQLGTSISPEYLGSFHCFFRYITTGATTSYQARIRVLSDSGSITTFTGAATSIAAGATTHFGIAGLGKIDLPPYLEHADADESGRVNISIEISSSDGTDNLRIVDLWVMPIDEWAMDASQEETGVAVMDARFDSLQNPRRVLRAGFFSSDAIIQPFRTVKNGPAILQANTLQRLWFLIFRFDVNGRDESYLYHSMRLQLESNQRYFSYRGDQ